ncbi:MAG: preprotein translocase subunit SecE [Oxalobacter sp.]|nr:MAG: preprotein translocase subunit SecE [Oxalobacter sp.]
MSNQSVQTVGNSGDKVKVMLACVAALAGVVGFYFLSGKATMVRTAVLVAGMLVAAGLLWTSAMGRGFVAFAQESIREAKRVVWPTRNESLRVTAVVFGFVLIMALYLWGADRVLEFVLYDVILGWKK